MADNGLLFGDTFLNFFPVYECTRSTQVVTGTVKITEIERSGRKYYRQNMYIYSSKSKDEI